jgi:hypothetical protein
MFAILRKRVKVTTCVRAVTTAKQSSTGHSHFRVNDLNYERYSKQIPVDLSHVLTHCCHRFRPVQKGFLTEGYDFSCQQRLFTLLKCFEK